LRRVNSPLRLAALAVGACFTALSHARECPKPPVWNSEQAVCYATVYAKNNDLRHGRPLTKKVTRSAKVWTVHFVDTRRSVRGGGWDVDVDIKTGTVTRFKSYKEVER
jgi:hypothetical protein